MTIPKIIFISNNEVNFLNKLDYSRVCNYISSANKVTYNTNNSNDL